MRKSIVYLMIAAVVLTGLFVWGGNQGSVYALLGDNVTYTLPYLTTASDKPVYCVVSNMTQDNASIHFFVVSDGNALTTSSTQQSDLVSGSTNWVYAFQTRMISFEGQNINLDGSKIGSINASLSNLSGSYGGELRFSQYAANNFDGVTNALAGNVKYGTAANNDWSCGNMPMACFQGTTAPKRNLVGYMCSDEQMHRIQAGISNGTLVRGTSLTTAPTATTYGGPYNKIYTY